MEYHGKEIMVSAMKYHGKEIMLSVMELYQRKESLVSVLELFLGETDLGINHGFICEKNKFWYQSSNYFWEK